MFLRSILLISVYLSFNQEETFSNLGSGLSVRSLSGATFKSVLYLFIPWFWREPWPFFVNSSKWKKIRSCIIISTLLLTWKFFESIIKFIPNHAKTIFKNTFKILNNKNKININKESSISCKYKTVTKCFTNCSKWKDIYHDFTNRNIVSC